MAIYFFDKNQTLIKIAPDSATFEAIQTQELDDDSLLKDMLSVTVKGDEKLLEAEYMAVKSYTGNAQTFDMYRIVTDSTPDKNMTFTGMSLAPYELNGHILKDLRPSNQSIEYTLNRILDGTDWRLGYIDDGLPNVTTTFYYVSAKEALKELQSLVGCEFVFKVEISGQKITDKWIEIYKEMGNRTKKRFNYGTNALTVVRETNKADIYTALIGRGKGEEISSAEENESGQAGYGRKITFEDIEWSIAKGDPLDKPKGQYYLELPKATQVYGIKNIDGTMSARVGVVDFDDETDKNRLINLTYQQLLVSSRPKVLFKTTVANIGATGIGDTVTIHRHELGIHYQTRVRKIVRNKLNDNKTQVELGDAVVTASTKRAKENNATIKNLTQELEKVKGDVTTSQTSADGKNTIFYGSKEPERQRTGDTWYRPHPSIAGETQMLVWNGTAWELVVDSSDLTSVSKEVEEAAKVADEAIQSAQDAVEQIDTAVANAGFTSLDDTLKSMNRITTDAEQNAQQAITNASNAYDLAQTSISEAQTAQANSLTALGNADNALDGVSSLNIRVDDVESELKLKADNTFMNEDGTLTTLSNAITFNANRFSTDMSRIESRVESLAGEINLVILKDAFEDTYLLGGETHPNPSSASAGSATMRELVNVVAGESLALSKKTTSGDNYWRINFYDSAGNFIVRIGPSDNEYILTVPNRAVKMWVSYPQGSNPQIVRGTTFVPYRPNMADQMTTDEMVLFRNEYDEFADKTQRRMSAIDSSGGRLEVAENLITTTANGLALKADQTTVDKLTGDIATLGSQVDVTAGQISSKVWSTDIDSAIDGIEVGGRNLIRRQNERKNVLIGADGNDVASSQDNKAYYGVAVESGKTYMISRSKTSYPDGYIRIAEYRSDGSFRRRVTTSSTIYKYVPEKAVDHVRISYPNDVDIKMEMGDIATDWTPAPEDTDAKINHVESSLDIEVGRINALNSRVGSNETFINDLSLTPDGFWVRTARYDIATKRIEAIATLEQTVSGLQSTVADKASQSQVTQLATGINTLVTNVFKLEANGRNLIRRENEIKNVLIGADGNDVTSGIDNKAYYSISVESGKTYMISRSTSAYPSAYIRIAEYRSDNSFRSRITATSETYKYEPQEAVSYIRISYPNDVDIKMEVGNRVTPYSPAPEDTATTSQISQLADNINLRVTKGELLSQINVQAGGVLITSGTNKLNVTPETTYIEDGTIKSAMIESLQADKIKTGRLDASKVKVVNIDAENITANKTSFVQSAWNAINSSLSVTGSELRYTHSDGSYTRMNANGIQTVVGGSAYQHNYLTHVSNVTINSGSAGNVQWVQLPSVFKGKQFEYFMGATDIYGAVTEDAYYQNKMMLKRFVLIKHPDYNIDYANARIPILGYAHYANIDTRKDYFRALQGIVFAQY